MKKNNVKELIIILIIFLLIFSLIGCIFDNSKNDNHKDEKLIEIKYSLSIISKNKTLSNISLICPLFIHKNGSLSEINDLFTISSGKCDYYIENSLNGYGLFINSNQTFEISLKQKLDSDVYNDNPIYLSLINNSKNVDWNDEYYIYSNTNNNDIQINLKVNILELYGIYGEMTLELNENLKNGWNIYSAYIEYAGD